MIRGTIRWALRRDLARDPSETDVDAVLADWRGGYPGELAQIRERLRSGRDQLPLFDTAGFVRNLEAALRDVWRQHLTDG